MSRKETQETTQSMPANIGLKTSPQTTVQTQSPEPRIQKSAETRFGNTGTGAETINKSQNRRSPSYALTGKLMEASIQGSLSLNSIQMMRNILQIITVSDIFLTLVVLCFFIPQPAHMLSALLFLPHFLKASCGYRVLINQPRLNMFPDYIDLEKCPNQDIIRQMRFQWNEQLKIGFAKIQNKVNCYFCGLTICLIFDISSFIIQLIFQGRIGYESTSSFMAIITIVYLSLDMMIFLSMPLLYMDNPTINLKQILLPLKHNVFYFIVGYMNSIFKKGNLTNTQKYYDEENLEPHQNQSRTSSKRLLHKNYHTPEHTPEKINKKSQRYTGDAYGQRELKN